MQRLLAILDAHKYKIGLFALLTAASVVCVALVSARIAYSDSRRYTNLVWNLFLAWIPFILAYLAYVLSWSRALMLIVIPVFAALWLIFFPNAPYILTDLQHLGGPAGAVPLWFDVIMLIWFSWTGMLLGIVSLNLMQEIISRQLGRLAGWIFVFVVAGLTSIGLYLGRFIRLNSWDILQDPTAAAGDVFSWLADPSLRSAGFIGLYTAFFVFVYLTIHAFGRMLPEGTGEYLRKK
ncbi:MAG TPA: DUF1361 domain-containing protein, partial [Anaerolineales bacterium]|nr:DUF1361 domain-containing protein [Anaerolineales bacterium]